MSKQPSPFPLRLSPSTLKDEVQKEARSNLRSLNAEISVLVAEALKARRERSSVSL